MGVNTYRNFSLALLDGVIFEVVYHSLKKIWWVMLCWGISYE